MITLTLNPNAMGFHLGRYGRMAISTMYPEKLREANWKGSEYLDKNSTKPVLTLRQGQL